jgi:glycosyltransferase involved in cell wall biosynthesis
MNILYINHYAGSPLHGMEFRPYYLAREWVAAGHKVTIVAASFSHLRKAQPLIRENYSIEFIDGIRYVWLRTPKYCGNGGGRMLNMLVFILRLLGMRAALGEERYEAVLASSTYPFDNFIAARLAKASEAAHIFEVHDLWPLSPRLLGGYSKYHPFIVLTQTAENYAYRHCDAVVSLLPAAERYMRSHGLGPGKFHSIPNGIVLADWDGPEALAPELEASINAFTQGRFAVGYAGGHGLSNSLDTLIDAARIQPYCAFILVGQGPEKPGLQRKADGLGNVLFLDSIPKSAIPSFLWKMDALYLGWSRSPLYEHGISPNKLFDYMMAGKPVIHAVDAGNDPCADARCGISITPEDPQAIADAIRLLAAMAPAEREAMGKRGHDYVVAKHDYRVLAARFIDVMQEAIDKKRSARKRAKHKGKE